MFKIDSKTAFVLEIADAVLRSWWTVVAGVCLGISGGLVALHYMPKTFEASTMIFVARQQIPEDYVRTTVTDDMRMRMAALKEAVLSRPYLESIIKDNYDPAAEGEDLERLIYDVRTKVEVSVRRGLFSITYRDPDPERAATVVNTLAQLYIDENAQFRASRAGGTTQALKELAEGVLEELNAKEQAILDFKAKHPFETEDNLGVNLRMREVRQRDLETNQQSVKWEEEHLEDLKSQLTKAMASGAIPGDALIDDPYTTKLNRLQRELNELRTAYLDDHPSVRAKRRELEELRASRSPGAHSGAGASMVDAETSPAVAALQSEIRESEKRIQHLRDEQGKIRREIARYDARIEATPIVSAELAELTKGYSALKERYEDYQSKYESAKGAQRMEEGRKGEQFEIIERAIPSTIPIKPVRSFTLAFGLAVGILLFVGPLVLKKLLRPVVSSQNGIKGLAEVPLLVSIPELPTAAVKQSAWHRKVSNYGFSVVSVAVAISVVLFLYQ
jgi:polysaccharide chain length determinant protein (PEP-CTERM system associated)